MSTHSIGVGEVPGISKPATEMVIRASPVRVIDREEETEKEH